MATADGFQPGGRRRRRHCAEFRAQVVSACLQPGASIAVVARAQGLHGSVVRRWVKEWRAGERSGDLAPTPGCGQAGGRVATAPFVAVAVAEEVNPPGGDIRLAVRRGQTLVQIRWPVAQAGTCAQWLGQWLR